MSFDLALINGDIQIKADGSVRTVENTDKLKQDIVKVILTPINNSRFHPWYGTNIVDDNIGKIASDSVLFQQIDLAITDGLSRLQKLQLAQSTSQVVTFAETLASIEEVAVQRAPDDPRQVNVVVVVLSKDLSAVEEMFTINN